MDAPFIFLRRRRKTLFAARQAACTFSREETTASLNTNKRRAKQRVLVVQHHVRRFCSKRKTSRRRRFQSRNCLWTTTSNAEEEEDDDDDDKDEEEATKEELFFRLLKPRDRRHSKFLHSSRIEDVHWSRSSTSFLSCSLDGRAKIWRNVVRKSGSKSSAVKVVEEDVNAVRGGVRFAQLLYVNNENDENFDKENEDDLETVNAHLVCVGADCAVRRLCYSILVFKE